jgi:hypothetical protein
MGEAAQLEDEDDELYSAPQTGAGSSSAAPAASSSPGSKKATSKPKYATFPMRVHDIFIHSSKLIPALDQSLQHLET